MPFDRLRANGGCGRGRRGVRSRFSLFGGEVEEGDLVGIDGFDVVVREREWGLVVRFD